MPSWVLFVPIWLNHNICMWKYARIYKVWPDQKKTIHSLPIIPITPEVRLAFSKTMSSRQAEYKFKHVENNFKMPTIWELSLYKSLYERKHIWLFKIKKSHSINSYCGKIRKDTHEGITAFQKSALWKRQQTKQNRKHLSTTCTQMEAHGALVSIQGRKPRYLSHHCSQKF